ncbi:Rrf2 family transcriptional regulator [Altererythrobacter sp. KTW20L]|uniref:Rrf2 family transcriptional regulator n=1 Tax=Altererythrobacter sp. KTW20L TaxID=2942210 RepID=UPI0020C0F233|nr:Rrf2 family transcriptional regulator [Altererythrobacter sp. KTW20L]MCL6252095.1 Rrf2 family transcriptional regulator [Altererythrobacter sp. KTW20L]
MQLSLHTDYALRVLMMLGATRSQATIDEIALRYGISRNHLAKVVQALQAEGLVETLRGRGGGLRLARPPKEINVGSVVRRLERFDGFVTCMGGSRAEAEGGCAIDGACRLKPALAGALDAFLSHLDQFTLADFVKGQRRSLLERLAIDEPAPESTAPPALPA